MTRSDKHCTSISPIVRRLSRSFLMLALCLITANQASAFDGNRKGFVLGGGIGYSPHTSWDIMERNISQSHQPYVINVLFGYSFNSRNVLVWDALQSSYRSSVLGNSRIYQGVVGIRWFHYFSDNVSNNLFVSSGISRIVFDTRYYDLNSSGLGFVIEGGIEVKRHYQIGLTLGIGKSSYEEYDNTHKIVAIIISALAF